MQVINLCHSLGTYKDLVSRYCYWLLSETSSAYNIISIQISWVEILIGWSKVASQPHVDHVRMLLLIKGKEITHCFECFQLCFIGDTSNYITTARRNILRRSLTVFRHEIEHTVRLKICIPLKSVSSCSCCTFYSFQRSASITLKLWLLSFTRLRGITFYILGLRSVINY